MKCICFKPDSSKTVVQERNLPAEALLSSDGPLIHAVLVLATVVEVLTVWYIQSVSVSHGKGCRHACICWLPKWDQVRLLMMRKLVNAQIECNFARASSQRQLVAQFELSSDIQRWGCRIWTLDSRRLSCFCPDSILSFWLSLDFSKSDIIFGFQVFDLRVTRGRSHGIASMVQALELEGINHPINSINHSIWHLSSVQYLHLIWTDWFNQFCCWCWYCVSLCNDSARPANSFCPKSKKNISELPWLWRKRWQIRRSGWEQKSQPSITINQTGQFKQPNHTSYYIHWAHWAYVLWSHQHLLAQSSHIYILHTHAWVACVWIIYQSVNQSMSRKRPKQCLEGRCGMVSLFIWRICWLKWQLGFR